MNGIIFESLLFDCDDWGLEFGSETISSEFSLSESVKSEIFCFYKIEVITDVLLLFKNIPSNPFLQIHQKEFVLYPLDIICMFLLNVI
jgi:hypothetical protein